MVEHGIIITLFFTVSICLLTMLSSKLKVAYPILLVVAGLLFSLIPGIPKITINPDVIFLIFLPPILYEAAIFIIRGKNYGVGDASSHRLPLSLYS